MDELRQYIICITAAAIAVAILTRLTDGKSASGAITKMSTGLFLTFMIIHPLIQLDFSIFTDWTDSFEVQSGRAVTSGEKMANDAMGDIIKTNTEAYILDKAQTYGADLTVEVMLNEYRIPSSVTLTGKVSPHGKRQLQKILKEELDITEENQIWTG